MFESVKIQKRKFPFVKIILFVIFSVIVLFLWRIYLLHRLPMDYMQISTTGEREKLAIPPRPGVQGIVITGPKIQPLFFSIDLSRAGVRQLDWQQLRLIDPYTDVKITGQIDHRGRLLFSNRDVLMEGHTKAGMMIQQAMKTWKYTPYKSGRIQFWFNLPSKGRKLIIDTSGLRRKISIPDHIPIYDSQIHLIEGIYPAEIQIGGTV